ncbi:hypothetical protein NF27_HJ00180 [Candidatus Jidaibacter acanthamoeba]|uniref:Uncharacterized protein n=1 Tax=Candidatus Jidaibacter acanthamoebae TaxID=86105 RepID=A0A0C1QX33_9RICK|nr:hypothetical protein [Candidatus Jidaibacter acanthamoeba]KIE04565.1 hypothetical protein NF27_HJ00180 [Candidatus Jidaibacter acanthamoeba]
MATTNENNKNKNTENLSAEEKQKMHDNYAAMGQKGGNTTKETHGKEFYHEIGQQGGNARKEQMAHSSSYTKEGEENK